jgi:hypothetical protein
MSPWEAAEAVAKISRMIDGASPGLGVDRRSPGNKLEWSTAYALLGHTEKILNRKGLSLGTEFSAEDFDTWLLANRGCTSTGLPMWSLPYQRRIWGDRTGTSPGSGYTVPTALAIFSLSSKATSSSPLNPGVVDALEGAALGLATCSTLSDLGRFFWYSTAPRHAIPVNNATALAAAACQIAGEISGRKDLCAVADEAVRYLLDQRFETDEGPTWNYFGHFLPQNIPHNKQNDLLHETYVCQGLKAYKRAGGTYGDLIEEQNLVQGIRKFSRNSSIYDFPVSEERSGRNRKKARLIAVGQSLYLLSAPLRGVDGSSDTRDVLLEFLFTSLSNETNFFDRVVEEGGALVHEVRILSHLALGLAAST